MTVSKGHRENTFFMPTFEYHGIYVRRGNGPMVMRERALKTVADPFHVP